MQTDGHRSRCAGRDIGLQYPLWRAPVDERCRQTPRALHGAYDGRDAPLEPRALTLPTAAPGAHPSSLQALQHPAHSQSQACPRPRQPTAFCPRYGFPHIITCQPVWPHLSALQALQHPAQPQLLVVLVAAEQLHVAHALRMCNSTRMKVVSMRFLCGSTRSRPVILPFQSEGHSGMQIPLKGAEVAVWCASCEDREAEGLHRIMRTRWLSSLRVCRVSSASSRPTRRSVSAARYVMSPRLPAGGPGPAGLPVARGV